MQQSTFPLKRQLLRAFDWLADRRVTAIDLLTYLSLFIFGFDISMEQVKKKSYSDEEYQPLSLDNTHDLDLLLSLAKDNLEVAEDRRKTVVQKATLLLTLSSLLIGLNGFFLQKHIAIDPFWQRGLIILIVLLLLGVVFLLLVIVDVGQDMQPAVTASNVGLSEKDLKKSLINVYRQCSIAKNNRTSYLVDVYKVARLFFLASLSGTCVLLISSIFTFPGSDQSESVIRSLRAEPSLIELLRGPKGDPGIQGPRGEAGQQGEPGRQADFDYEGLVDKLLNDPRFVGE